MMPQLRSLNQYNHEKIIFLMYPPRDNCTGDPNFGPKMKYVRLEFFCYFVCIIIHENHQNELIVHTCWALIIIMEARARENRE